MNKHQNSPYRAHHQPCIGIRRPKMQATAPAAALVSVTAMASSIHDPFASAAHGGTANV